MEKARLENYINWVEENGINGFDVEENISYLNGYLSSLEYCDKIEAELAALKTRVAAFEVALAELKACSTCIYHGFPEESNECDKCLNGIQNYYEFDDGRYLKNGETE